MGVINNESRNGHPVNQDCEHRFSRLEYATFDEQRGVIKSLEEGVNRFDKVEGRINDLEDTQLKQSVFVRTVISIGTLIVVLVELIPVIRDLIETWGK